MKSRWKTVHLIGLSALVISLSVASIASAEGGHAAFKLSHGNFPARFFVKGSNVTFETKEGSTKLSCSGFTGLGVFDNQTKVELEVKMTGCKYTINLPGLHVSGPCGTTKEKETIKMEVLAGSIGFVNKGLSGAPAGVEFAGKPVSGKEPLWLKAECEDEGVLLFTEEISGHLIGSLVTKLNEFKSTIPLTYTETSGKQAITEFEGGPPNQFLVSMPWGKTGVSAETQLEGIENSAKEHTEVEIVEE